MKSIIQKGIIPARTQSRDKNFQISRPCEVVRSGQVRSGQVRSGQVRSGQVRSGHNICCLCSFLIEVSSCRVTYENCYKSRGGNS